MNKPLKKFVISILLTGGLFALIMYAFDTTEGKEFNFLKFLILMLTSGLGFTLINSYFNGEFRSKKENTDS